MNVECQGCRQRFLVEGANGPQVIEGAECPDCGGSLAPERDQPGGSKTDFQDLGHGNPLKEGILADNGWQNRMKRDESFASVKASSWHLASEPQHHFTVSLDRSINPAAMLHSGNHGLLSFLDARIDGQPIHNEGKPTDEYFEHMRNHEPRDITVSVHDPSHEEAARHLIENGAPQAGPGQVSRTSPPTWDLLHRIANGEVPPPPGVDPEGLRQSIAPRQASARVSEWGGGGNFMMDLRQDAAVPTDKFIVDSHGRVYSLPDPTHHEEIAEQNNLITPNYPRGLSLGVLKSDGTTDWYSHDNGLGASSLAQALEGHFKTPITVDPDIKPTTSEERFQIPNEGEYADYEKINPNEFRHKVRREQELVKQRGRKFPHYDNPIFNRGGSTLDQTIHYPWGIEKEADIGGIVDDIGDTVSDAAGAVGDAAEWGVNEVAKHPVDAALTAAMFVPGIGTAASLAGRAALTAGRAGLAYKAVKGAEMAGTAVKGAEEGAKGAGALSKLRSAVGTGAKSFGRKLLTNSLANAVTGDDDQAAPSQGLLQQAPSLQLETSTDTPTSLSDVPGAKSGDPEDADTQEFNDKSDTTNAENPERDEAGGADTSEHHKDADELLEHFLPYLLAYYVSDESGADDPIIKQVREALERDYPGGEADADDDHTDLHDILEGYLGGGKHTAAGNAVLPTPPNPAAGPNPQQRICPQCQRGVLDAQGACHQCGFGTTGQPSAQEINRATTPGVTAKTADTQGPVTPEQQKLVAQFLIQQGRAEEIPTMLDPTTSWQYADELQAVQNDTSTHPPAVAQPSAPPAPPGMGMPPGGMGGPPPGDPSQQIAAAVSRFGSDNIAPRCPNCGSATTGILNDQGDCHCHACRNVWTVDGNKTHRHAEFEHDELHLDDADHGTHHPDNDDDVSYTWETTDGEQLTPGNQYEMHSTEWSVPDVVKVIDVKPGEIVIQTQGKFKDLEDEDTVSTEEAQKYGLTFVPTDNADAESENGTEYAEGNRPRVNTDPTPASAVPFTSSATDWNNNFYFDGASNVQAYTGTSNTTTAAAPVPDADWLLDGVRTGAAPAPWETPLPDLTGGDITATPEPQGDDGADWLLEGVPGAAKVAGAKFTPQQQREFIDEDGEARNLDRLDLEGTHYKTRETSVFVGGRNEMRYADPDRVNADDFALGF